MSENAAPAEEQQTTRWRLTHVAAGIVLGFLGSFTGVTLVNDGDGVLDFVELVGALLGQWIGYGVVMAAVVRRYEMSLRRSLGLYARWRDLLVGVPAGAASWVGVQLLYFPLRWVAPDTYEGISDQAEQITGTATQGWTLAVMASMVVVGTPVVEEAFYRAVTTSAIAARWSSRAALVGSAAVFGLVHDPLIVVPGLFAFGIVLGLLVQRYQRLGPCIAAHATFNGMTVVLLAVS